MNPELENFSKIFRNDLLKNNIRTISYDLTDKVLFTDLKGYPICNIHSIKLSSHYAFHFKSFKNYKNVVKNIILGYIITNNGLFNYEEVISNLSQINKLFSKNIIKQIKTFKSPIWKEFDRPSIAKLEVGSINFTFGHFKIFDSMSFSLENKYGIVKSASIIIQELEFYSDKYHVLVSDTAKGFSDNVYTDFQLCVMQYLKSLYFKHNGTNNINPSNDELLDFSLSIEMLEY